jgi:hypothetical protein
MLYVAPSILLVAAVAATQPVPTKRGPDEEQKKAAATWVKDGIAWTNELTAHGERLGAMLAPIMDGKQTGGAMRAELKKTKDTLDAKRESFKARPYPAFAEMEAFRTTFLDYLAWENRILVTLMSDLLAIAEDKRLKPDKKEEALLLRLRSTESDENVWKAKIQSALQAVQTVLNRK